MMNDGYTCIDCLKDTSKAILLCSMEEIRLTCNSLIVGAYVDGRPIPSSSRDFTSDPCFACPTVISEDIHGNSINSSKPTTTAEADAIPILSAEDE